MHRRLLASVLLSSLACFGMLGLAVGLNWSPKLGLDLEGGLSVVYKPAHTVTSSTLDTVVNIIRNRVSGLGVSQPSVTTQGGDVVVQLPGVKNPGAVLRTLGNTAVLLFRPVIAGAPPYSGKSSTPYAVPPAPTAAYTYTSAYYVASSGNYAVPTNTVEDPVYAAYKSTAPSVDEASPRAEVILPGPTSTGAARYVLGPAVIDNKIINGQITKSAYAQLQTNGQWSVELSFTGEGSTLFNDYAAKYVGTLQANDLDGVVISAPVIQDSSYPNGASISGNFTQASANALALDLNYGALPVALVRQTAQTVSPSLGKSSLDAGLAAGLLGLLLVMGYTVFYYRALGVVVVAGLVTTAAFLYGLISLLGASSLGLTLDLSGVTGLIVSVGITVDSYVVFFERLKDEVRAGRSVRASVDRGFKAAYRTILSADAVSFIGALVLWLLSVGAVRGFAFMLGISTLTDVVTAYVFTRPLVILLGRSPLFTEAPRLGIARGLARVDPAAAP